MDENHQDKMDGKLPTTGNTLWYPPLSPRDQEQVARLRKKLKKAANKGRWGFSDKTGWDWLQLFLQVITALALPLVLFWATKQFNDQQNAQQNAASSAYAIEQQQETRYQAYLDRMSDLIKSGNLAEPHSSPAIRALAQSQTFSALRLSDPKRKGYIIQFLHDALLLAQPEPIINLNLIGTTLRKADLTAAHLNGADLSDADLSGAILYSADLTAADLSSANLNSAHLSSAHLNSANLTAANLTVADLSSADLTRANLTAANLTNATLSSADLTNATLSDATLRNARLNSAILRNANLNSAILYHADLSVAHLTATTLRNANLNSAILYYADLSDADLSGAILYSADLSDADLSNARNLIQSQLKEVHSCTKVILPTELTCPGNP
jgi:uncharacterized protein YjbI with pentapeptide repeats